ncbi:uncharacterized protein LOC129787361 [Lutzomyia longipalpis]|uniref:Uncharacterized protein n=1 Tax=Lutzomyia longipalpis TaxID=7200 RepID=A0A1B0CMF1_LUTLO|nr:uncharacterized protein LOC129787361 [Lutzomyia longipalpis]
MSWKKDLLVLVGFLCSFCAAHNDSLLPANPAIEDPLACHHDRECPLGEFCSIQDDDDVGVCESCGSPLMTYNYEEKSCVYCPIFRSKCYNNCCYLVDGYPGYEIRCIEGMCMRCHKSDVESHYCTLQSYQDISAKFIVAFGIVFTVAFASIVIYRWSFRGRRQSFTERRCSWQSTNSVSPVQQRTLELLQDRPPEYQTRHNYRHQQEMKAKTAPETPEMTPTVMVTLAPPPYPGSEPTSEGTSDNVQPPPYSPTEGTTEKTLHI